MRPPGDRDGLVKLEGLASGLRDQQKRRESTSQLSYVEASLLAFRS
jgi:hypothetical protein